MTPVTVITRNGDRVGQRSLAIEMPVAVEVNGIGYAVMMATPDDLDVFATGFMLTERLADTAADIVDSEVVAVDAGTILRITLAEHCAARIVDRVRHRTSDTGCGLCGIANLESVVRPAPTAPAPMVSTSAIFVGLDDIGHHQPRNGRTGAMHAAALCDSHGRVITAYEDVGRHNALDKLVGAIAIRQLDTKSGFLLVTSRISFEMVDKALICRAPMLVGISAATTLALEHARAHGLTLAALARRDSVLLLNDPHRIAVVAEEGLEPPTPGL